MSRDEILERWRNEIHCPSCGKKATIEHILHENKNGQREWFVKCDCGFGCYRDLWDAWLVDPERFPEIRNQRYETGVERFRQEQSMNETLKKQLEEIRHLALEMCKSQCSCGTVKDAFEWMELTEHADAMLGSMEAA